MDFRRPGLLLLAVLAGCGLQSSEPQPGIYRAVIESPSGELPFGLELAPGTATNTQGSFGVFLLDGAERLPAERVAQVERTIEVLLPGGKSTLTFTTRGVTLSGYLRLTDGAGTMQQLSFQAQSGPQFRFFRDAATDNADVAGHWSTSISNSDVEPWRIADLVQSHDQLAGTLHASTGRQHAVTGQVQGDEVRLSGFDGSIALLLAASVNTEGELEGEYWSSLTGSSRFRARRNPDAEVEEGL